MARKRFTGAGGDLRPVGLQPHVQNVFDITGLSDAFPMHDDMERAGSGHDRGEPAPRHKGLAGGPGPGVASGKHPG